MPAVDAEMVFIAESRNREIDPGFAVLARFGLGVVERPARVAILLPQFGGLCCPVVRDAALLDLTLFGLAVALLWRGDDRGIDDLTAHRQKPSRCQRRIKALEQDFDRRFALDLGSRQGFAKGPDRIRIRHHAGKPQTEKAHELSTPERNYIGGPE